ncbi:MAG: hypothetical protein GXO29_01250 [Thermotogae bacterium]|nr:hypothetical protein [Thermotogota bacterium]
MWIVFYINANGIADAGDVARQGAKSISFIGDDHRRANVIRALPDPVSDMGYHPLPPSGEIPEEREGAYAPFTPLWGSDALVRGEPYPGFPVGIAMDVADDGEIFVAVLMTGNTSGQDTVEMWSSTDGRTWVRIPEMDVIGRFDPRGVDIAVGPGSNPWIYVVVDWDSSSAWTVGEGIYLRRIRRDLSTWDWVEITSADTASLPALSVNNDGHVAMTYITDAGAVVRGISTDSGLTWSMLLANDSTLWTSVYLSDSGRGYQAYVRGDTSLWLITFDLPSISASNISVVALPDTARQVSITAGTGASSSQEVVALWANRHVSTNVWDVHYITSSDGGATWGSPSPFPPTNFAYPSGNYMAYPYVHRDRHISSFRFVATFVGASWDSVMYAHSASATGWDSLITINDHNGTTQFGARVDYCYNLGGGCVAYREYAEDRVWFDGYLLTAVSERREVPSRLRVMDGGVEVDRRVRIFTVDGRLLKVGEGFIPLRSGMYLIEMDGGYVRVMVR